jgi:putative sterol carrier protein
MPNSETITLPRTPPADRLNPEFRETTAITRFDLSDNRSFMLTLDHGSLDLREGRDAAPTVFACSPEDFRRALRGELNLLTAFMRGDVRISGDLGTAKTLYRYLRLVNAREDRP